ICLHCPVANPGRQSSSRSSSLAPSSRGTPASIGQLAYASDDVLVAETHASPASMAYSYVNINAVHPKPKPQQRHPLSSMSGYQQPAKKVKTASGSSSGGGGFISRFFNSAASNYKGGRVSRAPGRI
ncbi:predicted protein, partial [Histoplasma capsulatum H143]